MSKFESAYLRLYALTILAMGVEQDASERRQAAPDDSAAIATHDSSVRNLAWLRANLRRLWSVDAASCGR